TGPAPHPRQQPSAIPGYEIPGRPGRQPLPGVDPAVVRKRGITRSIVGWLVMISLLLVVAASSYVGVSALISQFDGISTPNLPSLPGLPSMSTAGGPLSWLGGLFRRNHIYIVNLSEGLNLRSQPDVNNDANIMIVVPNGTPVTKLEDPVVKDNIPWMRVSVEVGGKHYEGWMSLKYLRQEQ
ncbi:MAG: SH3 domain-containing protein, partial [Chloroflexales bacterium]